MKKVKERRSPQIEYFRERNVVNQLQNKISKIIE